MIGACCGGPTLRSHLEVHVSKVVKACPPVLTVSLWRQLPAHVGGRAAFEKRLCEEFVNPSLIISTELENKSPANDAEPEIMPGF